MKINILLDSLRAKIFKESSLKNCQFININKFWGNN